jgi:serine/threonine protein kinase/tetratricopeptide (TPR) repeat protein
MRRISGAAPFVGATESWSFDATQITNPEAEPDVIGKTLAHYRILEKVGAGGMGEVYRAADTRLGREVALKILPTGTGEAPGQLERFLREARALATLSHPNIVTIHSVEEVDGVHFLTMELVKGRTLEELVPDDGLPVDQLLGIATAMAGAIAAAHDRGIVHRDLKPANVMVSDSGMVKMLDFGLAKLAESFDPTLHDLATVPALTQTGMIMGTIPYMSPEQISGRVVDHRTDLFSLGIILYEMSTGTRPFTGETAAELSASILRDEPESIDRLRFGLPDGMAEVVRRCLLKNPDQRFQSAHEVLIELKDRRSGAAVTPRPDTKTPERRETGDGHGFWVAVLPFESRRSDSALPELADGITEEIVTGLSRFSYLRVIARSSTLQYAGDSGDVRAIGTKLGARFVLEGGIRQAGTALRVSAQLVDAVSGAHLWAEAYNRTHDPSRFFELVDDIALRIGSTIADMNGVLPRTMSEVLRSRDPLELSPYEAVLRTFGYVERLDSQEHALVRECLERAVENAPGDADCWAMLSFVYSEEHKHGFNVRPGSLDRALEAARRAVAIAPTSHLGYHVLAQAFFFRRELQAFRNAAEKAIALNPMDGCTIAFMGILMSYAGDWDRGCSLTERAMELNPHHPGWYRFSSFFNAYRKGEYQKGLEIALKFNMPSYFYTHMALAAAYGQLGDRDAAARAVTELLHHKPDFAIEVRAEFGKWLGPGELLENVLDGLRKAGLPVPE